MVWGVMIWVMKSKVMIIFWVLYVGLNSVILKLFLICWLVVSLM